MEGGVLREPGAEVYASMEGGVLREPGAEVYAAITFFHHNRCWLFGDMKSVKHSL
jgi:hypothetical protein